MQIGGINVVHQKLWEISLNILYYQRNHYNRSLIDYKNSTDDRPVVNQLLHLQIIQSKVT